MPLLPAAPRAALLALRLAARAMRQVHLRTHTLSLSLFVSHTHTLAHSRPVTHPLSHTHHMFLCHALSLSLSRSVKLSLAHTLSQPQTLAQPFALPLAARALRQVGCGVASPVYVTLAGALTYNCRVVARSSMLLWSSTLVLKTSPPPTLLALRLAARAMRQVGEGV